VPPAGGIANKESQKHFTNDIWQISLILSIGIEYLVKVGCSQRRETRRILGSIYDMREEEKGLFGRHAELDTDEESEYGEEEYE